MTTESGMVLVPVEPTDEMLKEGRKAWDIYGLALPKIWRYMLTAAAASSDASDVERWSIHTLQTCFSAVQRDAPDLNFGTDMVRLSDYSNLFADYIAIVEQKPLWADGAESACASIAAPASPPTPALLTKQENKMKPKLGDIVIVSGIQSNGATEHPAIITRVWANSKPHVVNVTLFKDMNDRDPAITLGSVKLFPSKKELKYDVGHYAAYMP